MAIKENSSEYGVTVDTPITTSLFNYGFGSTGVNPPPPNSFMITEITNEIMISEAGDFMITEF